MEHVYVIGAGRSGTTLLSALLGSNPAVRLSGELLNLPADWSRDAHCACGQRLRQCDAWAPARAYLQDGTGRVGNMSRHRLVERHKNALKFLVAPTTVPPDYIEDQDEFLSALAGGSVLVDSSKHVARALAFTRLRRVRFRYVYIVRDCRGVAHSFGKAGVQRPKSMLRAAIYYLLVNLASEVAIRTRLKGMAIKLRYEDLVADPAAQLARLGDFLQMDTAPVIANIRDGRPISAGHMVSGNRASFRGPLQLRRDEEWRMHLGSVRRAWLYLLCLPIQVINGYRL